MRLPPPQNQIAWSTFLRQHAPSRGVAVFGHDPSWRLSLGVVTDEEERQGASTKYLRFYSQNLEDLIEEEASILNQQCCRTLPSRELRGRTLPNRELRERFLFLGREVR